MLFLVSKTIRQPATNNHKYFFEVSQLLLTNIIMCVLLYYQVTMPSLDNAKFSTVVHEGRLLRMNTQNGEFEICNENFKCELPK